VRDAGWGRGAHLRAVDDILLAAHLSDRQAKIAPQTLMNDVYGLFRFQSALIAPRSPPEWISDRKM
jgi:hypothetical protein